MIVFTRPRQLDPSGPFASPGLEDEEILPMTVGIGVLCENSKAGIIAADRLVSKGVVGDKTLHYTGPSSKIENLHSWLAITSAGDSLEKSVIERMRKATEKSGSVEQAVSAICNVRKELWINRVEQLILEPELGKKFQRFH